MKAIQILYCCVALMPAIIHGGSNSGSGSESDFASYKSSSSEDLFEEVALDQAQAKVHEIVRKNGTIKNLFRPTKFLGRGSFSNTYEGELVRGNRVKTVAMKFSPTLMMDEDIVNEYEMYTYLKAIDNETVESYGIPCVYFYGEWENCTLIAITLLDSRFNEIYKAPQLRIKDIDIFIICRESVRVLKYMHSFGVCHEDIKPDNLMFLKNRGFIIDFNVSRKVFESKCDGDCRKKDLESFLLSMCELLRMKMDWQNPINIVKTIATLKHTGLKRVFLEFARYAYKADPINYNRLHEITTEEIHRRGVQEPALVSWLTDLQMNEPITPSADIRSIEDPSTMTEFTYPEPNFSFFANNQ